MYFIDLIMVGQAPPYEVLTRKQQSLSFLWKQESKTVTIAWIPAGVYPALRCGAGMTHGISHAKNAEKNSCDVKTFLLR